MLFLSATASVARGQDRDLYSFDTPDTAKQWQSVHDGGDGGRSDGCFRITDNQTLEFFGTLSLENNGGFTS